MRLHTAIARRNRLPAAGLLADSSRPDTSDSRRAAARPGRRWPHRCLRRRWRRSQPHGRHRVRRREWRPRRRRTARRRACFPAPPPAWSGPQTATATSIESANFGIIVSSPAIRTNSFGNSVASFDIGRPCGATVAGGTIGHATRCKPGIKSRLGSCPTPTSSKSARSRRASSCAPPAAIRFFAASHRFNRLEGQIFRNAREAERAARRLAGGMSLAA